MIQPPPALPDADDAAPSVGAGKRFEARDELGRGGWGTVVRARDWQLDRDVALKRIHAELASDDAIRERFCNEARVTAGLQHPGVAPVHELGVTDDGAPFYVMKLLEGPTLRDAIREVHREHKPPAGGYSVELLERFVDICNTVACAHQQKIIHRDLKPSNVLVGAFGETVVVDWGLAKRLDAANHVAPAAASVEATLAPGATPPIRPAGSTTRRVATGGSATQHGSVLGTPAYMSPEQSRGEVDNLTAATDIYALGVILYEVLTGENPFRTDSVETTLERVRSGEYRQPRAVNRRAPKALAAICTTAMARAPEDRYPSAEAIVEDIRRHLAGEAVSVCPDPWWAKLQRWRRRHPALSAGLAGSAAVLMVASLVFGAVVSRAHKAERRARLAAEAAEAVAMQRLADAREAGDTWLINLSGALEFYPGMEGLRGQLLERAEAHYAGLAEGMPAPSPKRIEQTLEAARLDLRRGDLRRLQADDSAAKRHYSSAEATLLTAMPAGDPPNTLRLELLNARIGLALLGEKRDLGGEAWLQTLATDESAAESSRAASALARLAVARVRGGELEYDHAIATLQEAERLASDLTARRGDPRDHQLLRTVRGELATELRDAGRM